MNVNADKEYCYYERYINDLLDDIRRGSGWSSRISKKGMKCT